MTLELTYVGNAGVATYIGPCSLIQRFRHYIMFVYISSSVTLRTRLLYSQPPQSHKPHISLTQFSGYSCPHSYTPTHIPPLVRNEREIVLCCYETAWVGCVVAISSPSLPPANSKQLYCVATRQRGWGVVAISSPSLPPANYQQLYVYTSIWSGNRLPWLGPHPFSSTIDCTCGLNVETLALVICLYFVCMPCYNWNCFNHILISNNNNKNNELWLRKKVAIHVKQKLTEAGESCHYTKLNVVDSYIEYEVCVCV